MSDHHATIRWTRTTPMFTVESYNRDHEWLFGGGAAVAGSAAAAYKGNASLPNPEEALVVALSSCHMLSFLYIAAKAGFVVDRYEDAAVGKLARNAERKLAVTDVTLKPRVAFGGDKLPTRDEHAHMHHQAHEECFIASSVKTNVTVEHGDY